MTINEAITRADRVKPNQYETAEKVRWLSTLDGKIRREMMAWHEGADGPFAAYDPDGDLDVPLLVPEPYDELYMHWLFAQVDYHNNEIDRFNNCMVMFNMAYATFADWYNRTHRPRQEHFVRTSLQ